MSWVQIPFTPSSQCRVFPCAEGNFLFLICCTLYSSKLLLVAEF